MRETFASEASRWTHITLVEGKNPGLYMIENDDTGERFFHYCAMMQPPTDVRRLVS